MSTQRIKELREQRAAAERDRQIHRGIRQAEQAYNPKAIDPADQSEVDRLMELRGRLLEMQREAEQVQTAPPGFLDKLEPSDRNAIISHLSRNVTVAICFAAIAFLVWALYDLERRRIEQSSQGLHRTFELGTE